MIGHAQRRRAQRFADGEADEARPGIVAGDEQQNEQHDQQFHADQHHADAHARPQRDLVAHERFAAKTGVGRAGVGERVHTNAEPGHAVTAGDANQAEQQDNDHPLPLHLAKEAKVHDHDRADEDLQQQQELTLRDQVRLASLVNQLGDLAHGTVHREIPQARVGKEAEDQAQRRDDHAVQQEGAPVHRAVKEGGLRQVRENQIRFAASRLRIGRHGQCRRAGQNYGHQERRNQKREKLPERHTKTPAHTGVEERTTRLHFRGILHLG